jgi:threonine-phosphate decarboxylase
MKQSSQPWNVSIPAQMAGIAALKEKDYVKRSLVLLEDERTYLINELANLEFKIYKSMANYIFFKAKKGLYEKCLEKGILIRDCSNYQGLEEGYYRIVIKTREENKQLIEVLKEIINGKINYDTGNDVKCREKSDRSRTLPNI